MFASQIIPAHGQHYTDGRIHWEKPTNGTAAEGDLQPSERSRDRSSHVDSM